MNNKNNKLDLLRHLSQIGGDDAVSVFKSYIPEHYIEIYTLYEVLQNADIDYNDITFFRPQESGDKFIFLCSFNNSEDLQKLQSFLLSVNNKVQYMRHRLYKISVHEQLTCIAIKFKHV